MVASALPTRPKVLVVGHESSPTGAPLMLAAVVEWLRRTGSVDVVGRTIAPGPIQADFDRAGMPLAVRSRVVRGALAALAPDRVADLDARALARVPGVDVVYANCTATLGRLPAFPEARVVAHVHELGGEVERTLSDRGLIQLQRATVIAPTERVRDMLVTEHGVDAGAVAVVPEFVPPDRVEAASTWNDAERIAQVREALGVGASDRFVVAVGAPSWRKGTDLFLAVGSALHRLVGDRAQLAWVGGAERTDQRILMEHDARARGLHRFRMVPTVPDPTCLLAAADVLVVPSREDPMPLVTMEAALVGTPFATFDSGAGDWARDLGAPVVPYGDVDALATAVAALLDDRPGGVELARKLRERVLAQATIAAVGPKLLDVIRPRSAPDHGRSTPTTTPDPMP